MHRLLGLRGPRQLSSPTLGFLQMRPQTLRRDTNLSEWAVAEPSDAAKPVSDLGFRGVCCFALSVPDSLLPCKELAV